MGAALTHLSHGSLSFKPLYCVSKVLDLTGVMEWVASARWFLQGLASVQPTLPLSSDSSSPGKPFCMWWAETLGRGGDTLLCCLFLYDCLQ